MPSLARETGLHPMTLRRALVGTGVVPAEAEANKGVSFDAEIGERLAARMSNSLPITQTPAYLNCNRTQAEMLVRNGVLAQLVPGTGERSGLLTQVATEELYDFLGRFRVAGHPVDQASPGMMNVIEVSEIARETVTDIVRLVLEGGPSRIEVLSADLRFRSVLVDPGEIKVLSERKATEVGYSAQDVAQRLGIFTSGVSRLRKMLDRDGRPFLTAEETTNARGTVRYRFAEVEVARFERAHVTLTTLAKERGLSSTATIKQLKEAGVEPIMELKFLNVLYFRRADL